jgi:hypothetical protein
MRCLSRFWPLLLALTAPRLLVAAAAPLSPDEAYYWVWSRALAPGYLDHPPMVALWIRLGTLLGGTTPLGVRLLAPLAALLGSWLLADSARLFSGGDRRAGWFAAVLVNATLLFGIGAVTITPDIPLLFFWAATLWGCARLAASGKARWFYAIGIFAGLALLSKYTAAFLGLGLAIWLFWCPAMRRWLGTPHPWAAGAIAILMFSPVLWWNAGHGWASVHRQGGRIGDFHPQARYLIELVLGQLALATPVVAVVLAVALWGAARAALRTRAAAWTLIVATTLPAALVFLQHALGDRVQGNWPAILYPGAVLAAALAPVWRQRRWVRHGIQLGYGMMLIACAHAASLRPALSPRLDPVIRLLDGWSDFAAAAASHPAAFIAAEEYGLASELAFGQSRLPVLGLDRRWSLFDLPAMAVGDQTGIFIVGRRHGGGVAPAGWATVRPLGTLTRGHGKIPAEVYDVYAVSGYQGGAPLPQLPGP